MKVRKFLSNLILVLLLVLAFQTMATIATIGQAIDNMASYAQLQKEKTQAEVKKNQLLTKYAQLQALSNIDQEELLAHGYIMQSQPIILSSPAVALAQSLPGETHLE